MKDLRMKKKKVTLQIRLVRDFCIKSFEMGNPESSSVTIFDSLLKKRKSNSRLDFLLIYESWNCISFSISFSIPFLNIVSTKYYKRHKKT